MERGNDKKAPEARLVVVYHPDFAVHGYPVLRDRVAPAFDELRARGLLDLEGVAVLEAEPAPDELASAVHSDSHIISVKRSGYYDVAMLSAGAVVRGAEEVAAGRALNSFSFTGTAGHHASHDGFWGFCYLNDVAMAVRRLRERTYLRRFTVLDIDPHFGDGTRDILGPDEEIMHINFHSGHAMGRESGLNNLDFNLPHDASDEVFLSRVDEALKAASSFGHDLMFIVFGHDNHRDDYGAFDLSGEVYGTFARKVKALFPRRVCYVLSGGSNPRVAAKAIGDVVEVLAWP